MDVVAGADLSLRSDLAIEGMSCAACASRIEHALADVEGVIDARVNFANGRATVLHTGAATDSQLRVAIERLGYLAPIVADHERAERKRANDLRRRFVVAVVLGLPVLLISMVASLQFDNWEWVAALLATPVVFWSGWPFHRAAWMNLRQRAATMDTLVSIGTVSAWAWSMVVVSTVDDHDATGTGTGAGMGAMSADDPHVYFETAVVIVGLILLGKWIEVRSKRRSGDAIRALADLGAKTARLEDGSDIAIDDLQVGMRFVVRPGEKIATDGVIVEGFSAVDTSMVTGESVPVDVGPADEVIGATVNTNGSIVVETTRVGAATALAQIIRLVDEAQGGRADVQRLADRVASVFVPIALGIAAVTLVAWLVTGHSADDAFTAAVAVLIIACPCALGLATPLAIMVGTGRAAELGIIIKGGEVLENTRRIDTIVLDKTGTITTGKMAVVEVIAPAGDGEQLIALAAAVESRSEHPIAVAITAGQRTDTAGRIEDMLPIGDFESRPGIGVTATVGGETVRVGRRQLFGLVPEPVERAAAGAEVNGSTTVFVGRGSTAEAVIVVADTVKRTSAEAIDAFHDLGLSVTMLTGDNERSAERIGAIVGVDRVVAELLPGDKVTEVRRAQETKRCVAMVGDGVNDAPALAQADLGIAIGTGADVAIEASDLTIVSGDLLAAADAIALSRRTLATIKGNLFWAFAYNIAAIPLAALGVLDPMIAAAAMAMSSLFVVGNSLRLRRFDGYRRVAAREPTRALSEHAVAVPG